MLNKGLINYLVNGEWAEWSAWNGNCKVDCTQLKQEITRRRSGTVQKKLDDIWPKLVRRRTCNNPAPINGGSDCLGDPEQTNECTLDCHLDGYWLVEDNPPIQHINDRVQMAKKKFD